MGLRGVGRLMLCWGERGSEVEAATGVLLLCWGNEIG